MRFAKNHTRVSLFIFSIVLFAFIFASILKMITNDTFAESETQQHRPLQHHFVTIYDQGKKITVKTLAVTVAEALERAGFKLNETDIIEPSATTLIDSDNFNINIYRSRPVIVIDGKLKKRLMTASYDARSIAHEAGFSIYDGDDVEIVSQKNFLEAGIATTYEIKRGNGETLTVETDLPFEEETREDVNLNSGEQKIIQEGEVGRKATRYAIQMLDGVEVSRQIVSEEIIKEPVKKIITVASKKQIANIRPEWEKCAEWVRQAGVAEEDLEDALTLIYHESGCRVTATNSSSGAYGIPQSLPAHKMATMGDDWETNPITQIKWMAQYVQNRYGGWSNALEFWWCTGVCKGIQKNTHWY